MGLFTDLATRPRRAEEGTPTPTPTPTPGPTGGGYRDLPATDPRRVIADVASAYGIPPAYLWIPLAVSYGESGWDPARVGDGGASIGLFQLHEDGVGSGMSVEERSDPRKNAEKIMPAFAQAIQDGVAAGLSGQKLFKYVWFTAERPADTPQAHQHMASVYNQATGTGLITEITGPITQSFGSGGTGTGDGTEFDPSNIPPTPLEDAQTTYYNTQAQYLMGQLGLDAAKLGLSQAQFAEAIRQWDQNHALDINKFIEANNQFDEVMALDKEKFAEAKDQFAKTFGLSVDQFLEQKEQFAKTFGLEVDKFTHQKSADLGNLTQNILQTRLTDRQIAGEQQVKLFQDLAPMSGDAEGKVAGALGRMFRGVTQGGAFPTTPVNVDLSLARPADMATEQAAAEAAARRLLGMESPTPMKDGGVVLFSELGRPKRAAGGYVYAPPTRPNATPYMFQGQQVGWRYPDGYIEDWAESTTTTGGGSPPPADTPAPPDDDLQILLNYLQGLDPTIKAGEFGVNAITALANLFGGIDPAFADQLLAPFLGEGESSGLGGQTQAAKQWADQYAIALEQLGIDRTEAATRAQQVANQLTIAGMQSGDNRYAADIQKEIAEIKDKADRYIAALQSGDNRYAANLQAETQRGIAMLDYRLGAAAENSKRAGILSELQANPRKIFEAVAYQANLQPSQAAKSAQAAITPDQSLLQPIPTAAPMSWNDISQGGLFSQLGGTPAPMAGGGTADGEILIVGDKGNSGNKARKTEEYVYAPPGTIVAPVKPGEDMTMENAISALSNQVTGAARGYPKRAADGYEGPYGTGGTTGFTYDAPHGPGSAPDVWFGSSASGGAAPSGTSGAITSPNGVLYYRWGDGLLHSIPEPPQNTDYAAHGTWSGNPNDRPQRFAAGRTGWSSNVVGGIKGATSTPGVYASGPHDPGALPTENPLDQYGSGQLAKAGIYKGSGGKWYQKTAMGYGVEIKTADDLKVALGKLTGVTPIPDVAPDVPGTPGGSGSDIDMTNMVPIYDASGNLIGYGPKPPTVEAGGGGATGGGGGGGAPVDDTPLGELAIETGGIPTAEQMNTTGLFDALGGASPEYQKFMTDTFGATGLPTAFQYNRMSPTQQGVFEATASANKVDPKDLLAGIVRDYSGFSPTRRTGEKASFSGIYR